MLAEGCKNDLIACCDIFTNSCSVCSLVALKVCFIWQCFVFISVKGEYFSTLALLVG